MKTFQQFGLTKVSLAVAIAMTLTACGGGSGGGSSTPTSNTSVTTGETINKTTPNKTPTVAVVNQPTTPTPVNIDTATPNTPATTNSTNTETQAFNLLNQQRQACGFGSLASHNELVKSAQNHNQYMAYVSEKSNIAQIYGSHYELLESSTAWKNTGLNNPYFSGEKVVNRVKTNATKQPLAQAVNYPYATSYQVGDMVYSISNGGFVTENIAFGSSGDSVELLKGLLAAPYHLKTLVSPIYKNVGIDYLETKAWQPTTNYAPITGHYLEVVLGLPQGQAPYTYNQVLTYPCNNVTGTEYKLTHEGPDPFNGHPSRPEISENSPIGQPVYILAPEGKTIQNISNVNIKPINGVTAPKVWVMFNKANPATDINQMVDGNKRLSDNEAFLIPDSPLAKATTYQVSYTLVYADKTQETKTFSFSTKS